VTGSYLTQRLAQSDRWNIYGASRRTPAYASNLANFRHVPVDLLDPADTAKALGDLTEITHVFSCGYVDRTDVKQLIDDNVALVKNPLDVLERTAPGLERIVLVQGTKYYGCHLGPFKTPARETDPRVPNLDFFYYAQEDSVVASQRGKKWTWSAVRPHSICGFAVGNAMNLITVIGVYAAVCKELGLPLGFPGSQRAYDKLFQLSDARLLAEASEWAALEPSAAGEAFNVTNGDLFRWSNVWPRIAELFGMAAGGPGAPKLSEFMADKEPVWNAIVSREKLKPYTFSEIASWPYGDYVFGIDYDVISDTRKARSHGLRLEVDSEAMLLEMLGDLKRTRVLA
jgi:nucleoside-diphosphate-sugar epimerase